MKRLGTVTTEHVVSFLLIITFGILLGVTTVTAQEIEDITPDQTFDIITLLQGQSATLGVSQSVPFGFHTVLVTSLGNRTLGASVLGFSSDALGWWTITALGTGGKNFADYKLGLVPWSGQRALIDISPGGSFAIVFSTVFLTKLPETGGLRYNISIGQ